MTSTNLSRKQLNFAQISIVCVDILKQCLIDILHIHIKPTDLGKEIRLSPSLTAGKDKLSSEQKDLCCPLSPGVPDYGKFDVTLLYKLIRNLCPKLKPSKEWGKEPDTADQKIGDDIERIRLFRNKHYAHPNSAEITESDFTDLWNEGKSLIHRIQIFTRAKGCKTDYGLKLTNISGRMIKYEEYTSYVNLFRAIYIERNVEVTCGDTAHFKADIRLEESAFLSVSWERVDGSARKHIDISCEKYKGSTSRQLNIHSVCKEDEGGYQAVISRNIDHKIFSNIGFLRTQGELPRLDNLKVSTDKGEICIHYSHTVLENSPRVNDIEWTKNKTPLDLTNHKYCGGGLENSCLTISCPTKEDGGEYSCTVSNAVGSVSRVVILEEPSAKISTNTPVVHGSETRFSCLISSCPSPEQIEWQKSYDGNTFHRIDIKELKYHGSNENPSSPVLCLPKTTFDDQQFYRIAVRNKIGECMSNTHFLEVTGSRPNITNATCTTKDRSVRLNCDVFLYDKSPALLDVYWTKTEQRLDIQGSGGKYSGVSTDDPSLTINNVNEHDAGEYQLTAINSVGPTKSDVIVLGVPDIVLKRINRNEDGSQCFTMTISSLPAPFFVQWSMKDKKSGTLQQININADEYKGTSNSFPRPELVVKHNESLENYSFRIQVENVIGSTEKIIPDETNPIFLKSDENTVNVGNLNRIYERRGRNIRFGKVFDELAEKFPEAKISRLKDLIQNSCEFEDVKSLERAKSARDCFRILRSENIFTPEDVMFLQHLLKTTECEELETKCIEYAKMHDAMYYYEKPPDNGYKNVHFHVVANIRCYGTENITKVRETVAAIVGCTIEEVLVNGYLHSASFILVLSIKNDFVNKLLALKRKDKDKLSKLSIDYFKIGSTTIRLEFLREKDEHTTVYPYQQGSGELSEKPSFSDNDLMELVSDEPNAKISTNTPVVHGSETRFSCLISSCPSPEQIEWQKSCDGNTFHRIDIKELKYHGSNENPSSPVLCLPKTTFVDQQFYRVVVRSKIGECMSNAHFLEVTGNRPNITNATCTTKYRSARLNCDVLLYDKSPALQDVYWTKNEQRLDIQGSGGKYSGVSTDDPSLTINNVKEHDAGNYQLTAINSVGPTKSDVIVLGVPDVVLERIYKNEDGSQCFMVTIKSNPAPFFVQWKMKDKKSGTFQQINVNADEYKGTSNSFHRPMLVVKHNETLENYSFRIEVENIIGFTEKVIPDETNTILLKSDDNTANVGNLNRIYERSGRNIRFGKVFNELAEKFPKAKISRLKDLIQRNSMPPGGVDDKNLLEIPRNEMQSEDELEKERQREVRLLQERINKGGRPLNVALIGLSGSGKSSFCNSIMAAFSVEGWRERNTTGHYGGHGEQVTHHLISFPKIEYLDFDALYDYNYPTLIDMNGFEDSCDTLTQELLRIVYFGRLPNEERLMDAVKLYNSRGLDGLKEKYSQNNEELRVDRIIFIASANNYPLPTRLMEAARNTARKENRVIPIFGVLTHKDEISRDDSDYMRLEQEFREGLGIPENRFLLCTTYCDAYDKHHGKSRLDHRHPAIDIPILKFMRQVCDPAFRVIQDRQTYIGEEPPQELNTTTPKKPSPEPKPQPTPLQLDNQRLGRMWVKGSIIVVIFFLLLPQISYEREIQRICARHGTGVSSYCGDSMVGRLFASFAFATFLLVLDLAFDRYDRLVFF